MIRTIDLICLVWIIGVILYTVKDLLQLLQARIKSKKQSGNMKLESEQETIDEDIMGAVATYVQPKIQFQNAVEKEENLFVSQDEYNADVEPENEVLFVDEDDQDDIEQLIEVIENESSTKEEEIKAGRTLGNLKETELIQKMIALSKKVESRINQLDTINHNIN